MRLISRPACAASLRQRCTSFSNSSSSGESFFSGWRSMPGTSPATSQLDWLISMTAIYPDRRRQGIGSDRSVAAWGTPSDCSTAPKVASPRRSPHTLLELTITDDTFRFSRNTVAIAAEAALDGFYVVRTNLPAATLDDAGTVRAYKSLAQVERAFRSLKGIDLRIRPLFHWLAPRVRAHVFLCLLAYHVEWHMRRKLAPMLYDDDDRTATEALRESIVRPAQRSPAALSKQTRGITADGLPVHSFRTLLADLATLTRNTVEMPLEGARALTIYARPTAVQQKAFALLGISPERTQ